MADYATDRAWADQYIPAIKAIVGPHLLESAPLDVDMRQATDLIVLNARDKMIGCRVRHSGYDRKYPTQFTIRAKRDSGAQTELDKIRRGFCDWMFYGHAAEGNVLTIARWFLIDLDAWRYHDNTVRPFLWREEKSNNDGTYFVAYDVTKFPPDPPLLIASSHPVQRSLVA